VVGVEHQVVLFGGVVLGQGGGGPERLHSLGGIQAWEFRSSVDPSVRNAVAIALAIIAIVKRIHH